jgi:hypothetical protein
MIRIIAIGSFGGRHYQIVAEQTRFKCCGAASHLQHEVEIPNSWAVRLVGNPTSPNRRSPKSLERLNFVNLARAMLSYWDEALPTE